METQRFQTIVRRKFWKRFVFTFLWSMVDFLIMTAFKLQFESQLKRRNGVVKVDSIRKGREEEKDKRSGERNITVRAIHNSLLGKWIHVGAQVFVPRKTSKSDRRCDTTTTQTIIYILIRLVRFLIFTIEGIPVVQ